MYDPLETDLSKDILTILMKQCKEERIRIAVIGGWATYFFVNTTYLAAFGKNYMESRDIDIYFDSSKESELKKIISDMGFVKDGYRFRWEKIYNSQQKKFVTEEEAKDEPVFNLIHIFLDLFSDKATSNLECWHLEPLKRIEITDINGFNVADINTMIALKCTAMFSRDKADKENKDACDLYALLVYSSSPFVFTPLLKKGIEKILGRTDLIYSIASRVLLDSAKQGIVEHTLRSTYQLMNQL